MAILKRAKAGPFVSELCHEHGMSNASFYKWRSRFGGMDASMITRLKQLEDESRRLKICKPKSVSKLKLFRRP